MIKVVNERPTNNDILCVGTHKGIFHCDEVIAIAILSILAKEEKKNICVIRSRDIKFLEENTDLLIDIGGGEFDHHQKGGNGQRENGVKYASAGLIWKKFGSQLIGCLDKNLNPQESSLIANVIDQNIIQSVDSEDNGQSMSNHPFQFITAFLPIWNKEDTYDEKFEQCVNVVRDTLENIIESYISLYTSKKELSSRIANKETHIDNILVIPCQNIPWTDEIIDYNDNSESKIDFVVFPYPDGGYALQCVPPSKENKFAQRISLPEEWAGETTKLPEISGVPSATFCQNGRFFARAEEYNDIIKMCQIATRKALSETKKKKLKK